MKPLGPFDEPIPSERLKQVAAIVPRMEVRDIRLVALAATLKAAPPARAQTSVDLDHKVDAERTPDGDALSVTVHFSLKASSVGEKNEEFLLLKAGFQLWYSIGDNKTADDEGLKHFGEVNAVHTIWPYFRELVQNLTARMGVTPLTVPLLKLGRPAQVSKPEAKPDLKVRPAKAPKRGHHLN